MSGDGWQQVKDLFAKARALPTTRRDALLDSAADPWLRREVASLLAADRRADGFLDPPGAAPPPAKAGPYRLLDCLGSGGMGQVYLAVRDDGSFQKRVAVKLLPAAAEPALQQRFRIERQLLAALEHPHIVRLLDGGLTQDGCSYLVMEYVPGLPIDAHCQRHDLPRQERLRLFQMVCSAVLCAHQSLVVHGDIKPGNILVTPEGIPKLLDFGAARLLNPELGTGTMAPSEHRLRLFTPEFASPEQLRGEPLTLASDVYSLGLLLHALLTGQRQQRDELSATSGSGEAPRRRDATARRLPAELESIVRMAAHGDVHRRYASVAHLAEDVARHLSRRPVRAHPPTCLPPLTRPA